MTRHLHIGGLVAAGFDPTGAYLLTVSHDGRGVFRTDTWERVARDSAISYSDCALAIGIGPIAGLSVPVTEIDYDTGELRFCSPDGVSTFEYDSGTLTITGERG